MARGCVIGIDVGGTKILGVALDPGRPAEPLAERTEPTGDGRAGLTDQVAAMVAALGDDVGARPAGVGIGLPGLVDHRGVLRFGPNLPGVVDADMVAVLGPRLGLPIVVDNDGNCAAWAEVQVGAARGYHDVTFVGLGTGIAGGLVLDGRLRRGGHGFAAEPGHMTVVPGGELCPCGRLGCWEAYASGTGLGRLARRAAASGRAPAILAAAGGRVDDVRGEHLTRLLLAGDPAAAELMEEFARWVALGISNLVNVVDPQIVVLGGTMVEVGDPLLLPVRAAFRDAALSLELRDGLDIVAATLGRRAGAIGAALLADLGHSPGEPA